MRADLIDECFEDGFKKLFETLWDSLIISAGIESDEQAALDRMKVGYKRLQQAKELAIKEFGKSSSP